MATPVTSMDKPVAAKSGPASDARPPRAPRPPRPNFRHIHQFPLPVNVHHVPPVIPHNPLSLISVALSYLTFLISPPRQEVYSAYFDKATSSIHVTDERSIKALWQMGFFGKGSLSRSEPSWLAREKKRRGLHDGKTSEEITRLRRTERRELKLERARMEKLAIEERLKAEAAARESGASEPLDQDTQSTTDDTTNATATATEKFSLKKAREARALEARQARELAAQNAALGEQNQTETSNGKSVRFSPVVQKKEFLSTSPSSLQLPDSVVDNLDPDDFPNEEHLQLSNEEAFFLAYSLGALQIYDAPLKSGEAQATSPTTTSALLQQFCNHSFQPPRDGSASLQPDDPFMISYTVYHHFRSLGWVIRSGVKFGTDYLLYNRGPVFSHAEFAVIIIPSYSHPYWSETEERKNYTAEKQARSWWWMHCVSRVQAQVLKSLVVCYVEVPPPAASIDDIGALFGQYKVREFLIKRWIPNRTRD
ncbi:tRNA-splicing endonuclease [Penicillium concentricum]|uniref:tRNA-splicing endonuclease subunit Sen2 n=1 Tax=Penicillium concentricum TaxID=293559 RepID=A0A9W9RH68_9EURO|nr:tRNA-splicing endonuclease [Penicillium concentricum]KAJ5360213.1 tRNA-splicing endonuclease [Penicillium concentricum]